MGRGVSAEHALRKYMPMVRYLVGRSVANTEDREDIEQQVALAILRKSGSVRPEAMRAYIRAICRNTLNGHHRARYREGARVDRRTTDLDSLSSPVEVFETLWRTERREALDRAVDALPQRYRCVVMVYLYQARNLKEVAVLLGIHHATARWRLHRAIELMRQEVGNGQDRDGHPSDDRP